ncbi:hypothetical protein ACIA5D_36970 [Actinoplanes sp. NPDC051513]|uniref:hypothetical protein n=1 Tax=Actinoplanes sp. NPDC051513 TaxID=3363908 RepID=UPI0037AD8CB4
MIEVAGETLGTAAEIAEHIGQGVTEAGGHALYARIMAQEVVLPGSPRWNILLGNEANDAAALFSHGLRVTRDIRTDYSDAAAAMSLLALGAEKLLKLTIGLAYLDRGESWPSLKRMMQIGHRIVPADVEARSMLDLTRGTAPGHLQEIFARIDGDAVLASILNTLDRFADKGRFYFLDSLGESPQEETAPHFMWMGMTSATIESDPELLSKMSTPQGWQQGRPRLNRVIVASLEDWWETYRAAWTTGANGTVAQSLSAAVHLLSR